MEPLAAPAGSSVATHGHARWGPVLLAVVLLGAGLRVSWALAHPPDRDEHHYAVDALWSHPRFPGERLRFLHQHARPHRVVALDRWELVEHGVGAGPWGQVRIGHPALQALLLGGLFRPWFDPQADSPSAELDRLLVPMRIVGAIVDSLLLAILSWFVRRSWGPAAAAGASAFYALAPWVAASSSVVRPDVLVGPCLAGAALLFWRGRERPPRGPWTLGAGLLLGLAVAAKQSAVLFFPLVLLGLAGARQVPRRLVIAGGVGLVVACLLADLGAAAGWVNDRRDASAAFPGQPVVNVRLFLAPAVWWALGDAFHLDVVPSRSGLVIPLAALSIGHLVGATILAFHGHPGRAAALLAAALLPFALVGHGSAVYRLLPGAWAMALLCGAGWASFPAATARWRAAAIGGAILTAVAVGSWNAELSRYAACLREADLRLRRWQADPALDPAGLVAVEEALARAEAVRADAPPTLFLAALVAEQRGELGRARELVARGEGSDSLVYLTGLVRWPRHRALRARLGLE